MAAHETAVGSKAEAERRAGDDFTRVHGTVIEVTELDGYIGDDSVVLYAPKGRPFRVRVTDTNVQDILRWMDRHHLDPFWDVELVEDMIKAAVGVAVGKSQEGVQNEMSKLTGGLNIPGLDDLLGGAGSPG